MKFKRFVIIIMLFISTAGIAFADSIDIIVQKTPDEPIDENHKGRRSTPIPLHCTISEEGIFIQGIDTNEIISYEAYDIDGACILACTNPLEFSSFVLSMSEDLEIRIMTHNYILKGYLIL